MAHLGKFADGQFVGLPHEALVLVKASGLTHSYSLMIEHVSTHKICVSSNI